MKQEGQAEPGRVESWMLIREQRQQVTAQTAELAVNQLVEFERAARRVIEVAAELDQLVKAYRLVKLHDDIKQVSWIAERAAITAERLERAIAKQVIPSGDGKGVFPLVGTDHQGSEADAPDSAANVEPLLVESRRLAEVLTQMENLYREQTATIEQRHGDLLAERDARLAELEQWRRQEASIRNEQLDDRDQLIGELRRRAEYAEAQLVLREQQLLALPTPLRLLARFLEQLPSLIAHDSSDVGRERIPALHLWRTLPYWYSQVSSRSGHRPQTPRDTAALPRMRDRTGR